MAPLDILIIVLVVFNVIIGIVMTAVLVQVALLARKINRLTDDIANAYRFVQRLEFLPSALVSLVVERLFHKK